MKILKMIVRYALGTLLLISGINKFGQWINVPYMQDAMAFVIDIMNLGAGFAIYILAIVEISIALALLLNRYIALATLALLPMMIAISMFHLFLNITGGGVAFFVLALNFVCLFLYREKIIPVLRAQ